MQRIVSFFVDCKDITYRQSGDDAPVKYTDLICG